MIRNRTATVKSGHSDTIPNIVKSALYFVGEKEL